MVSTRSHSTQRASASHTTRNSTRKQGQKDRRPQSGWDIFHRVFLAKVKQDFMRIDPSTFEPPLPPSATVRGIDAYIGAAWRGADPETKERFHAIATALNTHGGRIAPASHSNRRASAQSTDEAEEGGARQTGDKEEEAVADRRLTIKIPATQPAVVEARVQETWTRNAQPFSPGSPLSSVPGTPTTYASPLPGHSTHPTPIISLGVYGGTAEELRRPLPHASELSRAGVSNVDPSANGQPELTGFVIGASSGSSMPQLCPISPPPEGGERHDPMLAELPFLGYGVPKQ